MSMRIFYGIKRQKNRLNPAQSSNPPSSHHPGRSIWRQSSKLDKPYAPLQRGR